MKKHTLLLSNLIIILSIVIGFIGIVYKDTRAYQDLAEKHLENILSLSDTDISNHIENSMSKPVMVSKTMANDEFLKGWLLNGEDLKKAINGYGISARWGGDEFLGILAVGPKLSME